jgi:hypothetical protein
MYENGHYYAYISGKILFMVSLHSAEGCAVSRAVNRRLLTAAGLVRARVRPHGIWGGQSGTGPDFLLILLFSLPIIPTSLHSSSMSIIRGYYNMPNSGWRTKWTRSHPTPRNYTQLNQLQTLYGMHLFIFVFTKPFHWSLLWARWIQSTPLHRIRRQFSGLCGID